ncbi:MAG: outer membrane protein assembly factor BamD [Bdellovibrionaceae bacterium]|nr:outer membrane protein assembly factor BamD [Bdellovibrionales bacterium]MCB9082968.1 outer membrane protein assembly factor BamD [Pseudobdellovibrionaceae bacterium]
MSWLRYVGILALILVTPLTSYGFSFSFESLKFGGCERLQIKKIIDEAAQNPVNKDAVIMADLRAKADAFAAKNDYCRGTKYLVAITQLFYYTPTVHEAGLLAPQWAYKATYYRDAVQLAQQAIEKYPDPKTDEEMHLLIARSLFNMIRGPENDQTDTDNAIAKLVWFEETYPKNPEIQEVKGMLRDAVNTRSAYELNIGKFYLKKKKYMAAAHRCFGVINNYQSTTSVPEALFCMTKSYMGLGKKDEAEASVALLRQNFPESEWLEKSVKALEK